MITEDEQVSIQRQFDRARDPTQFGLVNAITHCSHAHRGNARWSRAFELEWLGGEVMRGDHQPPSAVPAWV